MTPETITRRNSALRTPHSAEDPTDEVFPAETLTDGAETPHSAHLGAPRSALTDGDDEAGFWDSARATWAPVAAWLRANLRPPLVWTEPPASLADLSHYAHEQPYAAKYGIARLAGVWWNRVVAMPLSAVAYYGAWIVQRPSRVAALAVLYTVLAHTTVGLWLPWPSWLP